MLAKWVIRVVAYDGVLPLVIWLTPWLIAVTCPNQRGLLEATAVALPVAGCLVRFYLGRRLINQNYCRKQFRYFQFGFFVLGLVFLVIVDCVIVLLFLMPPGAFGQRGDWAGLFGLWCIYFFLMVGAMYPGRATVHGAAN